MIVEAIKHLNKGKSGSSRQAIEKWVRENYALEESACNKGVKNALNANVENKNLWQVTGKGASGSFALMSDRPNKAIAAAAAELVEDKKKADKSAGLEREDDDSDSFWHEKSVKISNGTLNFTAFLDSEKREYEAKLIDTANHGQQTKLSVPIVLPNQCLA